MSGNVPAKNDVVNDPAIVRFNMSTLMRDVDIDGEDSWADLLEDIAMNPYY